MTKSHIPHPKALLAAGRSRRTLGFGIWSVGFGILLAASAASCAKAQAKGAPEGVPLAVPSPPARVLAPVEEPLVVAVPPPDPQPAAATPRTPPRPPVRRAETVPEPAPAAATPPEAAPAEPRELRPASPARDAAAEKEVRDTLGRAARDLGRVNYGRLSADARAQYDQSKRFTQQAEQALKDRNFVFAATLADKAVTLAAELLGR
jgi:type IV secretory pathway VirB10-like protein